MEESEKRRERLRVMRNEASEADGSPSIQSLPETGVLSNPLVETPVVHNSHAMSRFDYYTDPMAAYSGNKRQNNSSQTSRDNSISRGAASGRGNPVMQYPPPPFGPGNPQMTPQPNYYANQGMQHGWRPPSYGSGPMPLFNPHPEHQHRGFPNQPGSPSGHYIPGNSSGGPPMPRPGYWAHSGPPFPNQGRDGTPFSNPGRGRSRGQWTNNSPSPGVSGYARGGRGVGHRGDATSVNLYRKSMVEDPWKDLNPVVWRAAVTSATGPPFPNQGRDGTPFSNPGRGRSRGQWTNNSPSPGVSGYARGGRGVGHRGGATSVNLYRKSMVEDPWKDLNPVVWRAAVVTSARSSEVFRKLSSDAKKPRVEEVCTVPKPKESLADYLAAAFDEAAEGGDAL